MLKRLSIMCLAAWSTGAVASDLDAPPDAVLEVHFHYGENVVDYRIESADGAHRITVRSQRRRDAADLTRVNYDFIMSSFRELPEVRFGVEECYRQNVRMMLRTADSEVERNACIGEHPWTDPAYHRFMNILQLAV